MSPQVGRQPYSGQWEQAPSDARTRGGVTPHIGDGVCRPTPCAVDVSSGFLSVESQPIEIMEERGVRLVKIAHIGQPIILLGVDVQVVIVCPAHVAGKVVIPKSLQGCR